MRPKGRPTRRGTACRLSRRGGPQSTAFRSKLALTDRETSYQATRPTVWSGMHLKVAQNHRASGRSARRHYRQPSAISKNMAIADLLEYIVSMTPMTRKLIERVANWPEEDLAELEEAAREIEARRSGVYVLSDEEWTDLQEGMAEADRGEFVPDDVIAEADKRHRS
jgi:predicted transcriptional regulator